MKKYFRVFLQVLFEPIVFVMIQTIAVWMINLNIDIQQLIWSDFLSKIHIMYMYIGFFIVLPISIVLTFIPETAVKIGFKLFFWIFYILMFFYFFHKHLLLNIELCSIFIYVVFMYCVVHSIYILIYASPKLR
jgi:hypothetical protein